MVLIGEAEQRTVNQFLKGTRFNEGGDKFSAMKVSQIKEGWTEQKAFGSGEDRAMRSGGEKMC